MARQEFDHYLSIDGTYKLLHEIFVGAGLKPEHADLVADVLVSADLRGISSHGVSRVKVYCDRIDAGLINKDPQIKIVNNAPAALTIDADNAMGVVAGVQSMDWTIERAKTYGVAMATTAHMNHYGIAYYYAKRAAEKGMIGMSFTVAPPTMPPHGSMQPMFGTNPICVVIPTKNHKPFVFDAATSVVARGKINLAEIEGKPIPDGWALDREGNPTNNATEALLGSVLPFGTYKGSALSMIISFLCNDLSGATSNPDLTDLYRNMEHKQDIGALFVAMDISKFTDIDDFEARVDRVWDEVHNAKKQPGVDRIYMPGEIEYENEDYYRNLGVGVGNGVLKNLKILCERYHLDIDPDEYLVK